MGRVSGPLGAMDLTTQTRELAIDEPWDGGVNAHSQGGVSTTARIEQEAMTDNAVSPGGARAGCRSDSEGRCRTESVMYGQSEGWEIVFPGNKRY